MRRRDYSRRENTTSRTRAAATVGSSCSQTRMLNHPASASRESVSRSRAMLPLTLSAQNPAFVTAMVWCSGHPCHQQPSRKTATRSVGKTRSAVRRTSRSGRADTRYRSPSACTAERSASSGLVSRPRFDFMLARAAADDAHDSATWTWYERRAAQGLSVQMNSIMQCGETLEDD